MSVHVGKRLIIFGLIFVGFLSFANDNGWAQAEHPRLIAPEGTEIDLDSNTTKCFGSDSEPVEARWKTYHIKARYLEYNRNEDTIRAKNRVKIKQDFPENRIVTCNELFYDLKRDLVTSQKEVKLIYDEKTTLTGDYLEWDRKNDLVKVTGTARILYQDWQISGERIEGELNKGIYVFHGPVKGSGKDSSLSAGQIIFDLSVEKIFLKNNPVVVQGKNEFTAPEIVYDLKTRKISSKSGAKVN